MENGVFFRNLVSLPICKYFGSAGGGGGERERERERERQTDRQTEKLSYDLQTNGLPSLRWFKHISQQPKLPVKSQMSDLMYASFIAIEP